MTKTLSIVSRENQNLNANEAFVIFLTSKLIITCFIGGFTSKLKFTSHLFIYSMKVNIYIYWIWTLKMK